MVFDAEYEKATNKKNIAFTKTLNERATKRTKEECKVLRRIEKITQKKEESMGRATYERNEMLI